jgi:p-hydroxybenzoate 3-monooxygenase
MLHRFDEHDAFHQHMQLAELAYVASSHAAATTLAENHAGQPLE